jgi:CRISPR/Cas system-associated endonuclease Cas1
MRLELLPQLRPSLVCDLIEPLRCAVELTVARNLEDLHETKRMAGHFAEMMETQFTYREHRFRLRSIIRLTVESFVRSLDGTEPFQPFLLHARDACR